MMLAPDHNDGAEISAALADEIASWRRVLNTSASRAPENFRTLYQRAAIALWKAFAVDATVEPETHDLAQQAVVDALAEWAAMGGILDDDAQYLIAESRKAAEDGDNVTMKSAHGGKPWPFVLFDDIEIVPKEWLAGNFLGASETSCWYGEPGCGKSVLIEDFGLHVAAGMPWLGRKVKQGGVLYIALERAALVKRRASAFKIKHNAHGLPFAVMNGVHDFRDKKTADAILQIIAELERATGQKVTLIIIDTISRALCGGDENSPKDMGALVNTLGRIHEATGAHLALVHHVPHGADRMRGHGLLYGAVDASIYVVKNEGVRSGTVVKANDSDEGERVAFTLESVTVCAVEDTVTTAPVVVPSADAPSAAKGKVGPAAALALRLLHDALAEVGTVPPTNNHIPSNTRTTTVSLWRSYCDAGTVSESDKPDSKLKAFVRASKTLQAAGLIGVWNDHVWSAGQAGQGRT